MKKGRKLGRLEPTRLLMDKGRSVLINEKKFVVSMGCNRRNQTLWVLDFAFGRHHLNDLINFLKIKITSNFVALESHSPMPLRLIFRLCS